MGKVIINGKEVSQEELKKLQEDYSVRLVELQPGVYKTLQKLNG